jgi:two-component system cell cycle sensor histidine kinase/response regulator CckA
MRRFRELSIQKKLTLLLLLVSGAALGLAGAAAVTHERLSSRAEMPRVLAALADLITANSVPALVADNRALAQESLDALRSQEEVRAACLYTRDGRLFAFYRKDTTVLFPTLPDWRGDAYAFDGGDLVLFRRLRLDGEPVGTLYLRADSGSLSGRHWWYAGLVAATLLGIWLAAFGLALFLQRLISRPIVALADLARRTVPAANAEEPATASTDVDEITALSDGWNAMVARVAEREAALREARGQLEERVGDRTRVLQESERRFRNVLQNLELCSVLLDRDGTVRFCNRYLLNLTGWSDAEVLHRDYFDLWVPPEQREAARTAFARSMRTGAMTVHEEMEILTRQGERRLVSWTHTLLEQDPGRFVGTASIGVDVTEQRQREDRQRQSQKLEAVGRLAGGVAHDFNNLLTIILGYSDLTLMSVSDPELTENVQEVKHAAERAAALTKQLLAFSRRQVLQPRVLDLNSVVGEIEKMLRRLIGEDIELRSVSAADLGRVKADRGQIEQVLVNLVVNARDAMPAGGRLTIETCNVDLDTGYARTHAGMPAGSYVRLSVSDTGHGMDVSTQSRMFEPFFTTKKEGKGTGLGLATVYGIVKQSGGHVWVYSEPGRGTTFKIYLPRVFEEWEQTTAGGPSIADLRGTETVLLVEDDVPLRKMTAEVLERFGFRVLQAGCAEDALVLVSRYEEPIHVMLTDLVLPRMTGRQLASQLTSSRPEIRVVYMSGYADEAAKIQGPLTTGQPFLSKPFTPDLLMRKLRETLDAPESRAN